MSNTDYKRITLKNWAMFTISLVVLLALSWYVVFAGGLDKIEDEIASLDNSKAGDYTIAVDIVGNAPGSWEMKDDATNHEFHKVAYQNLYKTLTVLGSDGGLKPGLADKWFTSDNGKKWTFHIKNGYKFNDGTDIDTEAIVKALEYNFTNTNDENKKIIGNVAHVAANGDDLIFLLNKPMAVLPWLLAGELGGVAKHEVKRAGKSNYTDVISSGQYDYEKTKDNVYNFKVSTKTKHDGIDSDNPKGVSVRWVDEATAVKDLNEGQVQYVFTERTLNGLDPKRKVKMKAGNSTNRITLAFNGSTNRPYPALGDRRFRQGIRKAIDSNAIMNAVSSHEDAKLIGGSTVPGTFGYEDLTGLFPYDWQAARAESTSYFGIYRINFIYPSSMNMIAGIIEANLRQVDQYMNLVEVPDDQYATALQGGDYDMAVLEYNGIDGFKELLDGNTITNTDMPDVDKAYEGIFDTKSDEDLSNAIKNAARVQSDWSPADWLFSYANHVYTADGYEEPSADLSDLQIDFTQLKKTKTAR